MATFVFVHGGWGGAHGFRHVRDVVNHILYEDLDQFVLVGFSYGGFVVTGCLEHIAERVRHLVFLDAFVPKNGESPASLSRSEGRSRIQLGEDWLVTGPIRHYDYPDEAEWMNARRTPHPRGCFGEPVYLSKPLEEFAFTRTYIKATRSPHSDLGDAAFWRAARHAERSSAWRYFELPTNHMVANNMPEETVRLLEQVANAA